MSGSKRSFWTREARVLPKDGQNVEEFSPIDERETEEESLKMDDEEGSSASSKGSPEDLVTAKICRFDDDSHSSDAIRSTGKWLKHTDLSEDDQAQFIWKTVPNVNSNRNLTPENLFELFFDEHLCNSIVEHSKRCAKQKGQCDYSFTISDLRVFLAVLVISGYSSRPHNELYWCVDKDLQNIAISNAVSKETFFQQMEYLSFANTDGLQSLDKYAVIRPLFDDLNIKFRQQFVIEQDISVNELLVTDFHNFPAAMVTESKPEGASYKMCCCCTREGYLVQFDSHQEEENALSSSKPELDSRGSTVLRLVSKLPPHPYIVFTDFPYTSLALAYELKQLSVGLSGYIKQDRTHDIPFSTAEEWTTVPFGEFEVCLESDKRVAFCKWKVNTSVTVASTVHSCLPCLEVNRFSLVEGRSVSILQPNVIEKCVSGLRGTDRFANSIIRLRIALGCQKWWWPLFTFILDATIHNCWLLYKNSAAHVHTPLDHLAFRRQLVKTYLGRYRASRT